ncbi:MAG: ParB/RepB/Spo0J family partition protein [Chromatiales bacterium]
MLKTIPLSNVYPNPDQPRKVFDEAKLQELAASIKAQGLLQPIRVRPDGKGRYLIIAGERRYRAHQLADLDTIAAIVAKADDDDLADQAIIENLHRWDLTPLEEAWAYRKRLDAGYSVEQLAERIGLKQIWRIKERLSLLNLRPEYQEFLAKWAITPSQAYEMSRLSPAGQDQLLRLIRSGTCDSYNRLRACADGLLQGESQDNLFELPEPPTPEERAALTALERLVEKLSKMLRHSFKDGEIVIVKKIDPYRSGVMADQIKLIQRHLAMIEKTLRSTAVQLDLVPLRPEGANRLGIPYAHQ